jgi:sugar phosphate isomerase/epimerase
MAGFSVVGCNIVEPLVDDTGEYTREIYIQRVMDYAAYGFSHVEFSHLLTITKEDAGAIREACRKAGIIPWSIHSEHLNEGDTVEDYLRIQTHCAEIADALDARVMVCHLPNVNPRFDFERDLKIIDQLAKLCEKYNLRLAIENVLCGDIDCIIRIIDELKRPNVGFNLDTGHALCFQKADVPTEIRKISGRLITTHLHDNFGINDDHQMPGLGNIDWKATLTAFKEVGYDGPLMMEMTSNGMKARRTVEQLRNFDLEKELIQGRVYLNALWR